MTKYFALIRRVCACCVCVCVNLRDDATVKVLAFISTRWFEANLSSSAATNTKLWKNCNRVAYPVTVQSSHFTTASRPTRTNKHARICTDKDNVFSASSSTNERRENTRIVKTNPIQTKRNPIDGKCKKVLEFRKYGSETHGKFFKQDLVDFARICECSEKTIRDSVSGLIFTSDICGQVSRKLEFDLPLWRKWRKHHRQAQKYWQRRIFMWDCFSVCLSFNCCALGWPACSREWQRFSNRYVYWQSGHHNWHACVHWCWVRSTQ